jgi:hypothetical protein
MHVVLGCAAFCHKRATFPFPPSTSFRDIVKSGAASDFWLSFSPLPNRNGRSRKIFAGSNGLGHRAVNSGAYHLHSVRRGAPIQCHIRAERSLHKRHEGTTTMSPARRLATAVTMTTNVMYVLMWTATRTRCLRRGSNNTDVCVMSRPVAAADTLRLGGFAGAKCSRVGKTPTTRRVLDGPQWSDSPKL